MPRCQGTLHLQVPGQLELVQTAEARGREAAEMVRAQVPETQRVVSENLFIPQGVTIN